MSSNYPIVFIPFDNDISIMIEKPHAPRLEKGFFGILSLKSDKQRYKNELEKHNKQYRTYEYQNILNGSEELRAFSIQQEFINKSKGKRSLEEYRNFDKIKRGLTEDFFLKKLKNNFPLNIYTGLVIKEFFGRKTFVPDFVFIDESKNIFIDIEIDEPYFTDQDSSNSTETSPIHYVGADDERDNYFLQNGWIVIRFSEEQIVKYPNRCQKEIAKIIFQLTDDYSYLWIFSNTKDLKTMKQWDYNEAKIMGENKYRHSYLKFLNEGFEENGTDTGIVKRTICWNREFSNDGKLKTNRIERVMEYDNKGNLTLDIEYMINNLVEKKTIMKYNNSGSLIEKLRFENHNRHEKNDLYVKFIEYYYYNEKNQITEKREQTNYSFYIYKYKYDANDLLMEETKGDENKVFFRDVYKNKNGKCTERSNFQLNKLIYVITNLYDSSGNLLKCVKRDDKNNILSQHEMDYDNNNDVIKDVSFEHNSFNTEHILSYISKGKFSELKSKSGFALWVKRTYDEKLEVKEEIYLRENGSISFKTIYKENLEVEKINYDVNGNIEHKTIYEYENWGA